MSDLGDVQWPPPPIRTRRLTLRESEPTDRAAFIDLQSSPEVTAFLGGPQPREALERAAPAVPGRRPGSFVVDLDGARIGNVIISRLAEHRLPSAIGMVDLGYLFLPHAWGRGYAEEACAAALSWSDAILGEPVVLTTQTANVSSMRLAARLGFDEVERFWAWGAEQWHGRRG
jgi:RimJ/RimL family protein N-acetyltransferase